jgi:hypothetical protein
MIEQSTYHSLLRILSAVVAIALVFESGLLSATTARLADNTELYLANAVGVSVGVAPNEYNQITAALTTKEKSLQARELAIAEREIEIGIAAGTSAPDRTTFILAVVLFILLLLIVLNYALDYLRARERHALLVTPQAST